MALNNNTDVNGNKDAVALLEQFRNVAKDQAIGYSVVIGAKEPNQFMLGYSGTVELEPVALMGLKEGIKQIEKNIDNRTMPEADPSLDDSFSAYNVTISPLSFDFVTWIVSQDMKRKKSNTEGPMKIGFWMGKDGKTGLSGMPDRMQMLNKVCRPALDLMGANEDHRAVNGKFDNFFSYKFICELVKEGIPVTKLSTKTKLDIEPGYVTITLREASYWPHRNSNMQEWLRFAKYLTDKGYKVIFIRDTAMAKEPVPGYETYPLASTDLDIRCALYQQADANLFVTNGPASLAIFGDKPYLLFMEIDDQSAYNASRGEYYRTCVGIDPDKDEQFPWSLPTQRLVFKPDYYTHMVTAWEKYIGSTITSTRTIL